MDSINTLHSAVVEASPAPPFSMLDEGGCWVDGVGQINGAFCNRGFPADNIEAGGVGEMCLLVVCMLPSPAHGSHGAQLEHCLFFQHRE